MAKKQLSEERHAMMLEMKPGKLIRRMALPTIIAMIVDSIYNLADTLWLLSILYGFSSPVYASFLILFCKLPPNALPALKKTKEHQRPHQLLCL